MRKVRMNMKIWILTEVEAVGFGEEVSSWSRAYTTQELAIEAMKRFMQEKIVFNEENGYPELHIDWQDQTGSQLSTLDDDRWLFKIEEVEVQSK